MGRLSDDLKEMGYEPTDKDSPFDERGRLWTNGVELVCDETAIVIDGEYRDGGDDAGDREYFRYPNAGKMRMIGGLMYNYKGDGLYGDS